MLKYYKENDLFILEDYLPECNLLHLVMTDHSLITLESLLSEVEGSEAEGSEVEVMVIVGSEAEGSEVNLSGKDFQLHILGVLSTSKVGVESKWVVMGE